MNINKRQAVKVQNGTVEVETPSSNFWMPNIRFENMTIIFSAEQGYALADAIIEAASTWSLALMPIFDVTVRVAGYDEGFAKRAVSEGKGEVVSTKRV